MGVGGSWGSSWRGCESLDCLGYIFANYFVSDFSAHLVFTFLDEIIDVLFGDDG